MSLRSLLFRTENENLISSGALRRLGLTTLGALVLSTSAQAGRVEVTAATASSTYPPEAGVTYDAPRAIDGKAGTSWVEGDDGSGLGAWLQLDLGSARDIDQVKIWAGMWYSSEFWGRANRPKELELEFSDGSKESCQLADEQKVQTCTFSKRSSSSVKLKLKGIHSGSTWLDTGISEVQVYGPGGSARVDSKGFSSSSELTADGDGSYGAANIADGVIDTMWCEGSKDGDGMGEWFKVDFASPTKVSQLEIINGVGGDLGAFLKSNRAASATLEFSDGSSEKVALKGSIKPQTVAFAPKTTSFVKITFNEVTKGKEFNDLCVSEAYFLP